MTDHDIRLIEIGQKEGYDRAVKEIVAWLRDNTEEGCCCTACEVHRHSAEQIEAEFGGHYGQFYEI